MTYNIYIYNSIRISETNEALVQWLRPFLDLFQDLVSSFTVVYPLKQNPTSKLGERNNVDLIDVAPLTALGINGQVRWADCPHWAQWTPADLEEIQLVSGSLFYKLFLKISRPVNETNARFRRDTIGFWFIIL